jgi:hypothetical protein
MNDNNIVLFPHEKPFRINLREPDPYEQNVMVTFSPTMRTALHDLTDELLFTNLQMLLTEFKIETENATFRRLDYMTKAYADRILDLMEKR